MESYTNAYRRDHSHSVLLSSSSLSSSADVYDSGPSICSNESELIPHGYRISRLSPPIVRSTNHTSSKAPFVAISASSSHTYQTNTSQDVLPSLNNSAALFTSSTASHNGPGSSDAIVKPSSPANLLAARYGLPQALPRPPRTTPHTIMSQEKSLPDFESLRSNYISMLANKPTDNIPTHTTPVNNTMSPVHTPAEMPPPPVPQLKDQEAALKAVVDTLIGTPSPVSSCSSFTDSLDDWLSASPEYQMMSGFSEYLSSPFSTPYDDFNVSPMDDSPFAPDLSTPIMDAVDEEFGWSGMMTAMDEPLFDDEASALYNMLVEAAPAKEVAPAVSATELLNNKQLYTMSPSTPALEHVNSLYSSPRFPSVNAPTKPSSSSSSTRKVSLATGTRRNITPDNLLPLDAPTQSRRYVTPSSTSRKDVSPAKKRSRSEAFEGDDEVHEDEIAPSKPPGPDATEMEKLEYKRRMSTIAARKSRRRKLEHKLMLEATVEELERDKEKWKMRCKVLQEVLKSHAVDFRFEDDE
ncbi:hypothetical protein DFJ43DRAFT_1204682 [Lentinula guzmanii]|uniref:BZIP domain-containing protein n=1 Tax=Lentinula guzmanii TaxID=2804957 RepID=A0AA38J5P3_9AGAR|nr:hypothetical protein DFJ43DRAFT_1204682 [Lentinula guzmanii]